MEDSQSNKSGLLAGLCDWMAIKRREFLIINWYSKLVKRSWTWQKCAVRPLKVRKITWFFRWLRSFLEDFSGVSSVLVLSWNVTLWLNYPPSSRGIGVLMCLCKIKGNLHSIVSDGSLKQRSTVWRINDDMPKPVWKLCIVFLRYPKRLVLR